MQKHDRGRWRCPRCGHIHAEPKTDGLGDLARRVVLGEDLAGISPGKRAKWLTHLEHTIKRQFGAMPPGEGQGWWAVDLPPIAGPGRAAVGVGRSPARVDNWRVLAFTDQTGTAGDADLMKKLGGQAFQGTPDLDQAGLPQGQAWLAGVLAVAADQADALTRLWIILGRTNAMSLV